MTSIDKLHSSRDVFLLQVRSFPDSNAIIFIVSVNTPTKSQNSNSSQSFVFLWFVWCKKFMGHWSKACLSFSIPLGDYLLFLWTHKDRKRIWHLYLERRRGRTNYLFSCWIIRSIMIKIYSTVQLYSCTFVIRISKKGTLMYL